MVPLPHRGDDLGDQPIEPMGLRVSPVTFHPGRVRVPRAQQKHGTNAGKTDSSCFFRTQPSGVFRHARSTWAHDNAGCRTVALDTPGRHHSQDTESEEAYLPHKWSASWVLVIGLGMIIPGGTIVGVALPSIITSLDLELTEAQWINSTYSVVFVALLPSTGRSGNRLGRKRLFIAGTAIFVVGSTLAALSGSSPLLLARVVQGIGGSMVLPANLSTSNAVLRGKDRAAAFGVWGLGCNHVRGRRRGAVARWPARRVFLPGADLPGQCADRGGRGLRDHRETLQGMTGAYAGRNGPVPDLAPKRRRFSGSSDRVARPGGDRGLFAVGPAAR